MVCTNTLFLSNNFLGRMWASKLLKHLINSPKAALSTNRKGGDNNDKLVDKTLKKSLKLGKKLCTQATFNGSAPRRSGGGVPVGTCAAHVIGPLSPKERQVKTRLRLTFPVSSQAADYTPQFLSAKTH